MSSRTARHRRPAARRAMGLVRSLSVGVVLSCGLALVATPARACDVALLLAMDVSGSVDRGEYLIQVEGLAAALTDPQIADVLVDGAVALAVVQWSGVGQQRMALPWERMDSPAAIRDFAERVSSMPRAYTASDTAVGDAIDFGVARFGPVSDCQRRVIDMSGDGATNAGPPAGAARNRAEQAGFEINGLAIESIGLSITEYYRRSVITRHGFVVTARGHFDYVRAIREKVLRELVKPSG